MKFWFYDFLDEITQNICKMWVEHKKKKNPKYKESENLQKRVKLILRTILIVALGIAIGMFFIQIIASL